MFTFVLILSTPLYKKRSQMIIAVNTRMLFKDRLDGIGRLSYEVMSRLARMRSNDTFYCIYDRKHDSYYDFGENVHHLVVSPQARHPLLWKIWFDYSIPRILKKLKADCFISLDGYNTLNSHIPTIIFGHDIAPLHFPHHMKWIHRKYYQRYLSQFLRSATAIVANSDFTKKDIIDSLHIPTHKVHVAYSGHNDYFKPLDEHQKNETRDLYTAGKPYFIFTGTRSPRKNIVRLIEAFELFKDQSMTDHKLVIVGRPGWKDNYVISKYKGSKNKNEILFLEDINDKELAKLVGAATGLVFASLYEGFGLPIVEAMAANTPVITSNTSAMPEVAGDAAIIVDPYDVTAIADAILQLSKDEDLRAELIQKGARQYLKFNWDDQANKINELILNFSR